MQLPLLPRRQMTPEAMRRIVSLGDFVLLISSCF
jgi:hypothetical protein